MKKIILAFLIFITGYFSQAQSDTMYVYKNGVVTKIPINNIDSITFSLAPRVADIAGNSYATVKIGSQTWMAENLRTHLYNDGTPIQKEVDAANIPALSVGVYSWYDTDSISYDKNYGKMYNGYVVTGSKNVCPVGWRVPTDADVTILFDYLSTVKFGEEGGLIKDDVLKFWSPPNTGAINSSGFSALPYGYFNGGSGSFTQVNLQARFFTSTYNPPNVRTFGATNSSVAFNRSALFITSLAPVRCIKE